MQAMTLYYYFKKNYFLHPAEIKDVRWREKKDNEIK